MKVITFSLILFFSSLSSHASQPSINVIKERALDFMQNCTSYFHTLSDQDYATHLSFKMFIKTQKPITDLGKQDHIQTINSTIICSNYEHKIFKINQEFLKTKYNFKNE